ncbi:MAG: exonuclease SbcCD subunit D [Anaerovoracaceae bacterium]
MKLIHLSDLHIGKKINEFSMLEDQKYIFDRILQIVGEEEPQGILLAGDIYDKSVPSAEAVALFDRFLTRLSEKKIPLFIISGNHDNPQRLSFGGNIMRNSKIYVSPVFSGKIEPVILSDDHGEVGIFLLPFLKPAHVRSAYKDAEIDSYQAAVKKVIGDMTVLSRRRNVLVAHQFVTGGTTCGSEDIYVGDTGNISADLFEEFDYVALGHLHRPQNISRETLRYCGSPLKYSFSEASHTKSVTVVELEEKGKVSVRTVPLEPLRDMREIKGKYMEISAKSFYQGTQTDDYIHVILTDEEDVPDALGKLRSIYPNIMRLTYHNTRTWTNQEILALEEGAAKHPLEIIGALYEMQNNCPMNETQRELAENLYNEIWEVEQ